MKFPIIILARISGVLLIIVALVLMFVNPKPENNLPQGFFTPIIAFEFIQSPDEVNHFFDVANNKEYIQSMLSGNWIDYGFMLLYSCLIFCVARYILKESDNKSMYLAMLFAVLMLVADALENYQIYLIVSNFESENISSYLNWLSIFTWLKWSSIAASFLLFSPYFLERNLFHKTIGLICLLPFLLCIAAFIQHGILNEIFALSVVIVFVVLIIFVFMTKTTASKTV